MEKIETCPCGSGKNYRECCQVFHLKGEAPNALLLMRSRYSAYAKHLCRYIIATTHPQNPHYCLDLKKWEREILQFSKETQFLGLEIQDYNSKEKEATVTFVAHLMQSGQKKRLF